MYRFQIVMLLLGNVFFGRNGGLEGIESWKVAVRAESPSGGKQGEGLCEKQRNYSFRRVPLKAKLFSETLLGQVNYDCDYDYDCKKILNKEL